MRNMKYTYCVTLAIHIRQCCLVFLEYLAHIIFLNAYIAQTSTTLLLIFFQYVQTYMKQT